MSIENKIELLWNSAKTLHSGLQTQKMLKSYYINICRKLVKNTLQIPKEKFSTSHMCPYCGCFWNDSEFGLKLIPKQFNNCSKTKKLIEKLEQANGSTGKFLNKNQKNRAKWLKKKNSNHLAISCYQCKRKSLLKIENPKYKTRKQFLKEKSETEKETPIITTGKISINQYQQLKNKNSISLGSSASTSLIPKSKKEVDKSAKISKTKNKKVSASTSLIPKSKKEVVDKSTKISKTKNKKMKNNNAPKKVVSKTQKQNSLLQLAALLHKQSKGDMKNSAQNRLESFLK